MICSRSPSTRFGGAKSVSKWWRVWGGRRRLSVRSSELRNGLNWVCFLEPVGGLVLALLFGLLIDEAMR